MTDAPDDIEYYGTRLSLNVNGVSSGKYFDDVIISGYYGYGEGTQRGEVIANSGPQTALTYPMRASNGSTGLGLGNLGGRAKVMLDYEVFNGSVILAKNIDETIPGTKLLYGIQYEEKELYAKGRFKSTFPFGMVTGKVSMTNKQEVTSRILSFPVGIQRTGTFVPNSRVSYTARATLAPGINWSELDGYARTRCTICAAPEDRLNFDYNDSETSFNMNGELRLSIDYKISKQFTIGLNTQFDWNSSVAFADNRDNPSDAAPGLGHDNDLSISGGLLLGVNF